MPQTYRVTLSDGRAFDVATDGGPPSEQDVLGSLETPAETPAPDAPASDAGGLGLAGLKRLLPIAEQGVSEIATNPNLPRAAQKVGATVGGLAGLKSLNPLTMIGGMMAGGKAGRVVGGMVQGAAMPVAKAATALAPYAQTLGTLSGAQGVGDLAQMAEPQRKDIGFLGMGKTQHVAGEQPALLNLLLSKLMKIGSE